ncbi:hypothetical protein HPB50_027859 [Hyalomma asiaticum]|nr:hypothetical protein HPB50_027859 [Hyalomma asiaticum]
MAGPSSKRTPPKSLSSAVKQDAGHTISGQLLIEQGRRFTGNLNIHNFKTSSMYIDQRKNKFEVNECTSINERQKALAARKIAVAAFH